MFPDITQYLWLVWLVVVVACVVMELLTLELLFLMIAAGSLVGGLGGWLLDWPWYGQVGAAAILSGLLVFLLRPLLHRLLERGREEIRTNVDALYGMNARATVAFQDGAGMARLANGETWTARLTPEHEADAVPPGARLTVARIDGATAVVVPATDPAATNRGRSSE
jgi:membrane protein implicated in regulation of membrane protease activity